MKIAARFKPFMVLSLMAFLLAGCAANSVTPAQEAVAHYKMGLNRMSSGNDEAALYEFNTALSKDPGNADAHYAAGIVYYKQSNYDAAIREFSKAISINPRFADAHNDLGSSYARKKEYQKALKEFAVAKEEPLYQSREKAILNIGLTYDIMGEHEKSAEAFREALLVNPDSYIAMVNLGSQYNKLGRVDEAIKYYAKALQAYPNSPEGHLELGLIYFKAGKQAEALTSFQKAKELAPGTEISVQANKYIELLK